MMDYFADDMIGVEHWQSTPDSVHKGQHIPGVYANIGTAMIIPPQPLGDRDIKVLPDGERVNDYRNTWADLNQGITTRAGESQPPDILGINGEYYKVLSPRNGRYEGDNFAKYTLQVMSPDQLPEEFNP